MKIILAPVNLPKDSSQDLQVSSTNSNIYFYTYFTFSRTSPYFTFFSRRVFHLAPYFTVLHRTTTLHLFEVLLYIYLDSTSRPLLTLHTSPYFTFYHALLHTSPPILLLHIYPTLNFDTERSIWPFHILFAALIFYFIRLSYWLLYSSFVSTYKFLSRLTTDDALHFIQSVLEPT